MARGATIALRTSGNKVTPYLTTAGSVERMKDLQSHPKVQAAQDCIRKNAGNKTEVSKCMSNI